MAPAFRPTAAQPKPRRWMQVASFCVYAVLIMTFAGFLIRYVY
jgi:hypothetical protein